MLRHSLLLVMLILSLTSCEILPVEGDDPDDKALIGTWRLTRAVGGWTGSEKMFTHQLITLRFTRAGRYEEQVDGDHIQSGTYRVTSEGDRRVVHYEPAGHRGHTPSQVIRELGTGTLVLADRCMDCHTREYRRLR